MTNAAPWFVAILQEAGRAYQHELGEDEMDAYWVVLRGFDVAETRTGLIRACADSQFQFPPSAAIRKQCDALRKAITGRREPDCTEDEKRDTSTEPFRQIGLRYRQEDADGLPVSRERGAIRAAEIRELLNADKKPRKDATE